MSNIFLLERLATVAVGVSGLNGYGNGYGNGGTGNGSIGTTGTPGTTDSGHGSIGTSSPGTTGSGPGSSTSGPGGEGPAVRPLRQLREEFERFLEIHQVPQDEDIVKEVCTLLNTLNAKTLNTLITKCQELAELYPVPITRHFSVQHHISSKRLSIPAPPSESKSSLEDEEFFKLYGRRSLPVGVYAGVPALEEAPLHITKTETNSPSSPPSPDTPSSSEAKKSKRSLRSPFRKRTEKNGLTTPLKLSPSGSVKKAKSPRGLSPRKKDIDKRVPANLVSLFLHPHTPKPKKLERPQFSCTGEAAWFSEKFLEKMLLLGKLVHEMVDHFDGRILSDHSNSPVMEKGELYFADLANTTQEVLNLLKDVLKLVSAEAGKQGKESVVYMVWAKIHEEFDQPLAKLAVPITERIDTEILNDTQLLYLAKKRLLGAFSGYVTSLMTISSGLLSFLSDFTPTDTGSILSIMSWVRSLFRIIKETALTLRTFQELLKHVPASTIESQKDQEKFNSLWKADETDDVACPTDVFAPGSLDELVRRLTSPSADALYVDTFFHFYTLFCTPRQFFRRLVTRFSVPQGTKIQQEKAMLVQLQTANIIVEWAKRDLYLCDHELTQEIHKFCKTQLQTEAASYATQLSNIINRKEELFSLNHSSSPDSIPIYHVPSAYPPHRILLYFDPKEIAEQLTLADVELFQKIDSTEFLGQRWSKPTKQILAQNLVASAKRTDQISFWVASMILLQKEHEDRVEMAEKMINVARWLVQMQNMSTLFGFACGFNFFAVERLKKTWAGITKAKQEFLRTISQLVDPSNASLNLRQIMELVGRDSIPHLSLYTHDYTMADDGSDALLEKDEINFPKYNILAKVLFALERHQKTMALEGSVSQKQEPLYTFLYSLPALDQSELSDLSDQWEPRK